MLNTSWQVLTPPRSALITTIYNAAIAGSSVSDSDYNNFTQTTSWRLPYYQAFLQNELPYSTPPVGTCDAWFNASGLRLNSINNYGTVSAYGFVTKINDVLGGTAFGTNASTARYPALTILPSYLNQPYSLGCNPNALLNHTLTNAGAFVQNKTGYTLIAVANFGIIGSVSFLCGFSTGAAAGNPRLTLGCNASGAFQSQVRRLDADATAILQGGSVTNSLQIYAVSMNYGTGRGDLYINGINVASNAALTTAGSTSNTASLIANIGSLNQASIWNGCITDMLCFQTALSAADILTLSNWLNGLRSLY